MRPIILFEVLNGETIRIREVHTPDDIPDDCRLIKIQDTEEGLHVIISRKN